MRVAQTVYRDIIAILIAAMLLAVLILGLVALVISEAGNRMMWWGPAPVLERYKRIQAGSDVVGTAGPLAVIPGTGTIARIERTANLSSEDPALSTSEVRTYFEQWIADSGNHRLEVGPIVEIGSGSFRVDIVTDDVRGLAERFVVDRRTGTFRQAD